MKKMWLSEVIRILEADPEINNSKRKIRVLKLKRKFIFWFIWLKKIENKFSYA